MLQRRSPDSADDAGGPGPLPPPRRIHIDTDPGLDDLLALALALASPELEVVGLTTVAGNASLEAVTRNAAGLLALADVDLPLGRGAAGPLALKRVSAESFHGEDGRRGVALPGEAPSDGARAQQVLRESILERRAETVLALGPLTNIAKGLRDDPGLFAGVEILWMGGTLGPGNVTSHAEFNAWADPTAAAIVLGSGGTVRVIGLDVTQWLLAGRGDLPREGFGPGERGRCLTEIFTALIDAQASDGDPGAVLHDPGAVAALLLPECFRYESLALEVCSEEGEERGRLRRAGGSRGEAVDYAQEIDGPRVVRRILERLEAWCKSDTLRIRP